MEISGSIKASLQGRYASALFDLASESGAVSAVEGDLEKLSSALIESADLVSLIHNPRISRATAADVMDSLSKTLGLHELTRNFLGVLAKNRRLPLLSATIQAFHDIAAAARGEVTVQVASAFPLDEEQLETLRRKLQEQEKRTLKIRTSIDKELLGGLVVTIGSRRIDSSIRTRLNNLAQAMKG